MRALCIVTVCALSTLSWRYGLFDLFCLSSCKRITLPRHLSLHAADALRELSKLELLTLDHIFTAFGSPEANSDMPVNRDTNSDMDSDAVADSASNDCSKGGYMTFVLKSIASLPVLRSAQLTQCRIVRGDVIQFAELLPDMTALRVLNLQYNAISPEGAAALA